MTQSEVGAYFLLLGWQWMNHGQGLPDDERILTKLARGPVRPRVRDCFDDNGQGRLFNAKSQEQWEECEEFAEKQASNGRLGGRPKNNPGLSSGLTQTKPKRKPPVRGEEEEEVLNSSLSSSFLPDSGGGEGIGRGGPLADLPDAPPWLLDLSALQQRTLLAASSAKGLDLLAAALACQEWWDAHPTGKPARWFGRMDNWLKKADSQLALPRDRPFQPANTDPRRPVVEVEEP